MRIILDGRTDTDDYLRLSGVFNSERLHHTPLLVFITSDDTVRVRIVDKPDELLSLDDGTPVMGQWRGEWRSDFFQFTVGKYRQYIEAKHAPLKSARNVVKTVGPQGGFRSLSYEYLDEHGTIVHASTASRGEAERLEAFFARQCIPVVVQRTR
jgi:hypothetical protein